MLPRHRLVVAVSALILANGAAAAQESELRQEVAPNPASGVPEDEGPRHLPRAFDFMYGEEIVLMEGVVLGTWFGNTHSAVFFEPAPLEEAEDETGADTESEDSGIDPVAVDAGGPDLSSPPSTLPDPSITESGFGEVSTAVGEEELPPESTWWELETFPWMTLERGGWERGTLQRGDPVIVAVRPASTPLRAQLIGITRTTDGWTGLGHSFADFDMQLAIDNAREEAATEAVMEDPTGPTEIDPPPTAPSSAGTGP